ncbi:MAG: N-acetylmuramoyl-L-alanine amidase, partial [Alphaproteobacteria bacterium]
GAVRMGIGMDRDEQVRLRLPADTHPVAQAVAAYLEQRPGYKAVLTRDRDVFLRLRDRVRVGREAKADLFVSIHADSHPDRAVSGASLYTLSETASDAEAARLAQSENRADLIAGVAMQEEPPEVVGILLDLAQRETKNQSSAVADDLLFSLAPTQPLLNTPKRAAGFAVLKAPDVPSVLIELGFISNREDAARLNDPNGRDRIARAIAEGVVRYFEGANTARAQRGD